MNLFILICSVLFGNITKNITNYPYQNTESSGNDDRVIQTHSFLWENENEILCRIRKYYYYMEFLKYLESGRVLEKDKTERIKSEMDILDETYKICDLYSGGLLNDWEMDF